MAANYQNFRSPLRLASKMAFGSDAIGRWALMQVAATIALRPLQRLFARRERAIVKNSHHADDLPIILVVGGPRTGTTFASQLLARYLDVSFFNNATEIFSESPLWGTQLYRDPFAPTARLQAGSLYGNTFGLRGINDGFTIWNEWLGDDRYQANPIDQKADAMRHFFANWSAAFGKPLLNKNNRNLDAMQWLASELPNSVFVVVRRDPAQVASSLIAAREYVQGDKNLRWGLLSTDTESDDDPLAYVDRVVEQIQQIDRRIEEQLPHIDEKRWIDVSYSDYCESPDEFVRAVAKLAGNVPVRERLLNDEQVGAIPFRTRHQLSVDERSRLDTMLGGTPTLSHKTMARE